MRREISIAAVALLLGIPSARAGGAACPFRYTPELRANVVEPEVNRVTSGHAADFRTDDPEIFTEDDGNVRLQFLYRGLDGDIIVVVINPCTQKLVHSGDFPPFPALGACPPEAHAPAGAWCEKPGGTKN